MIYKIWLNKFENWIFPGHVKKGNFFTFYLKKKYCASFWPGKIQVFNLFHKKIALPKLYTNDSKLNYINFWLTEMIKTNKLSYYLIKLVNKQNLCLLSFIFLKSHH